MEEIVVGSLLKTRLNVVLKNNGQKSGVFLRGEIIKKAAVTAKDCRRRRFRLIEPGWDYDIDIEEDREFLGRHYLEPNEVDTFNVIFARAEGGPMLSVYKIDLLMHFDEQSRPLAVKDILIKVNGPSAILGERSAPMAKEEWCECMLENIRAFDAIGYDFRTHVDAASLDLIEAYSKGQAE